MTGDKIDVNPVDYADILRGLPPEPIPTGPVHFGGQSPVDVTAAAVGFATNTDLPESNTQIATDAAARKAGAGDAMQKFAANEADAVSQFQDVAAEGDAALAQQAPQEAMQSLNGAMQGITSALSGALGSVTKLPQGLMQASQGALSPLMSAAQSLGKGGLDSTSIASDIGPDPDLGGADFGSGGSGSGLGIGTTPASNLGPPPVPGTSTPTTPASSMSNSTAGPTGGTPTRGGAGSGGMMPMMPGGAGAGSKGGKDDKTGEKRIAAPGVPNGQPVKGRTTAPPNVPVTKSVAKGAGLPGIRPLKRIVDKGDSST